MKMYEAIAVMLCGVSLGCSDSDRYMIAKGDNNIVYRTDRKTGETVMIRGTTMQPVTEKKQMPVRKKRKLTTDELSRITGKAGLSTMTYFAGNLYNGNPKIELSSVTIGLTHKQNGADLPRAYTYICKKYVGDGDGRPLSSWAFGISIIRGDEPNDYKYSWEIIAAEGIDVE